MDYRNNMYSRQNLPPPTAEHHGFVPRAPYAHEAHRQFNSVDTNQYRGQLPNEWKANPESKDQNNVQYKYAPNNNIPSVQAMIQNRLFTKGKYLYPLSEISLIEDDDEYKPEIKQDLKPELKSEINPDFKSEINSDFKSEVKSEVKPELKSECKSEFKSEVKPELKSECKYENKDDIKYIMNPTTVIKGRGRGKRLKLMKCDESDNKSNVQTLSLTSPSNSTNAITLDSTVRETIHHSTEHVIVKSSEDFSTLVKLLQEQISTSKYTNKLLEDLLSQNNNNMSNGGEDWKRQEQQTIRENFRSIFPYMPANSVKDMLDMEHALTQEESRQLMVKRLRQCGGKSVCETTSILLRTVMTDECATFYNYEGKNNKKLSFRDLNIHEILIDVTLFVHNDETEQAITKKIKNWLRLANTRIGNKSGGQYRRAQNSWTEGSSFSCDPSFQQEHQEPPPSFQPEPSHTFQQEHPTFQREHHAFPQDHPFPHGHSIFN